MTGPAKSRGIRVLERQPEAAAVIVSVVAAVVIASWAHEAWWWPPFGDGPLAMIPNTAVGFLIGGCALWLGRRPDVPWWSLLASRILGATLAVAGVVFCYEALRGRDFGIDLRLFGDAVRSHGWPAPGRPATNAALSFVLVGAALATLDFVSRTGNRPAQWCATGALVVAFTALVGHLNGTAHLYNFEPASGMALLTALCFATLSLGVVLARRDTGLPAILVDDAAGGLLARRLFPAAVLVPIALGWLWLQGQRAGMWDRVDGPSLFVAASSVALVWLVARSARVVHITDMQRAQLLVREQEARREAETANRTKGDFLAVMSHELRTPLSAIIGYQELLADGITGPVTEAQRQQLGRIKVSARHLLQLIDEILTYSRAEAGKEEVQRELALVNAMVDEAAALVEPLAADKGVTFAVTRLDSPLAIRTDPRKVRQILVNLLSNAVKFTDPGGTVTLRARRVEDRLELVITDTGIGIPPEYLERIFDAFWQVEQKATRRAGGTGLGLSVSLRLARLLSGDIRVTSEVGRGSVFTVVLPVTVPAITPRPRLPVPGPVGVWGPARPENVGATRS
jgi:signal transduction histidine kinase